MTIGILHPPGVDGPFQDCPRLYFSDRFFANPPKWCEVTLPPESEAHDYLGELAEFDTERHHKAIHLFYTAVRLDMKVMTGWFLWPRGTRITHEFPQHKKAIWILTGRYFPLTTLTVYEGKWPD